MWLGWLEGVQAKLRRGPTQWSRVSPIFSVLGQGVGKTPRLAVTRTPVPAVGHARP